MIPKHLLFSGCSFTFGSSFISERSEDILDETIKPTFLHPNLEKKYGWKTVAEAKEGVKRISYPYQIGSELGVTSYNLAIQGVGIETHLQKLTAFILENKYNIDFESGEAIVMLQVADFSRAEFWSNTLNEKVNLSGHGQIEDVPDFLKHWFIESFNEEHQIYKYLIQLLHFKGFCESRGINFHPYSFDGSYIKNIHNHITSNVNWREKLVKMYNWEHETTILPDVKELIKELNVIPINPYEYMWDDAKSVKHATFIGAGYHEDSHFTEKGHKLIAKALTEFLTQKYNYGKH